MPQPPRTSRRQVPYPGYGQIPLFTPPFNPNAAPYSVPPIGTPGPIPGSGGPPLAPGTVVSGGSNQQVGSLGEQPALTPEQQALYAPDMVPQRSGLRGLFDQLTSQPNAGALLTMGQILSSPPMMGETGLGQAVRAIGGGMSARAQYAQMQAAQAEAARQAQLQNREQSRKELDTAGGVLASAEKTRQGDRELDIKEDQLKATTEQNKQELESLKKYRADRLAAEARSLAQADEKIRLAKDELAMKKKQSEDDRAFELRKQAATERYQKALADQGWARASIARLRATNEGEALKQLKAAEDIYKTTQGIDALSQDPQERTTIFNRILESVRAKKPLPAVPGGAPEAPAAAGPKEGDLGREEGTNKPTIFDGKRNLWVYDPDPKRK